MAIFDCEGQTNFRLKDADGYATKGDWTVYRFGAADDGELLITVNATDPSQTTFMVTEFLDEYDDDGNEVHGTEVVRRKLEKQGFEFTGWLPM